MTRGPDRPAYLLSQPSFLTALTFDFLAYPADGAMGATGACSLLGLEA